MVAENKPEFSVGDRVEITGGIYYVGMQGEVKTVLRSAFSREPYIFEVLLDGSPGMQESIGRYASRLKLIEPCGCKTDVSIESLMGVLNGS